ncbi:autotransporter assembly complex protein TamA [Martelella limonii]|uniref:autotransporter assembly complex protein TamA n=1 Tax=Martelella limonii TaxID=1647649 RepID=UPI0015809525|nr:autotransporter assembly complex family protein [Martelella limonii]
MLSRSKRKSFGIASALHLQLAIAAAFFAVSEDANAFSLFGIHLWGQREVDTSSIQDPVRYVVKFNVNGGDSSLDGFLRNRSALLGDENIPVEGDLGVLVKARDDLQILVGSLYEKAYYGGVVNIDVNGQSIENIIGLPDFGREDPVPVTVTINAGPMFTFANIKLEGAPASFDPRRIELQTGKPAYSTTILTAARTIAAELKDQGHPFATITRREVIANHANSTVDVEITAADGPVADLGNITVSGSEAVKHEFIERYSRLRPGQQYSPEQLTAAANRLRALKTFDAVTITTGDELDANGQLPTTITVRDGKFRYFGFGANVSSIDGLGLQGYWGHRNLFGEAEGLRLDAGVSRIGASDGYDLNSLDVSGGITFTKPGLIAPSGMFTASIITATENPDPYNAKSVTGSLGYTFEQSEHNTVSLGIALDYSNIQDAFGTEDYLNLSLPLGFDRDTRNDPLNATKGVYILTNAEPSYDFLNSESFAAFEAVGSTYLTFGEEERFTLAGRIGAGTIVGGSDLQDIPATDRFYAGGGGSVRGYAYKSISPRLANGEETGGRSYVGATVEARIGVTKNIQVVPFIDAADVSVDYFPDFSDIRAGAGIGVRYLTGFGPIRLDVAVPLDRYPGGDNYGIYAGIGQTF